MKHLSICLSFLLLIACSASAAEWNFYGSARVSTFYADKDSTASGSSQTFSQKLQSNARLGARVKVSDTLSGRFEYGASGGNANLRQLYGTWDFGRGSLMIGHGYSPLYLPVSNQAYANDNALGGWGEPTPGRVAQIKLSLGGFEFALVQPKTTYYDGSSAVSTSTEVRIPRLEASYKLKKDNFWAAVAAGYNSFEVNDSQDVDSYVAVATAGFKSGRFTLQGEIFSGQNTGNLVFSDVNGTESGYGYAKVIGNTLTDNNAFGYEIVAAFKYNDTVAFETGFGCQSTEYKDADEDEVFSYYLQAPITLAPGVFFVPEIGRVDYDEPGQTDTTYLGAKWQINF